MQEPTDHLVEPAEPDADVSKGFANPIGILDAISVSHWVNEIIKEVVGYDVIGTLSAAFVGDWAAFWKAGDAFANLGGSLQSLGGNLIEAMNEMDRQWDGRAADAAYVYFRTLAGATAQQHALLLEVREQYHDAARGIWLLADMVGGLIKLMVDKAIIIGISAAAGTALAETGVGAVAGYAVATWQTIELVKKVNDAATKIQAGGTLILGFFSAIMALANQGGDLSKIPLPDAPYASPVPA